VLLKREGAGEKRVAADPPTCSGKKRRTSGLPFSENRKSKRRKKNTGSFSKDKKTLGKKKV